MTNELFRPEVSLARREAWIGTIRLQPLRLGWWALGLGMLSTSIIGTLIWLGTYTSHQRVSGVLVSSGGVLPLESKGAGMVARIFVKQGQHVDRDEAIAEISREQTSASVGNTYAAVIHQLKLKRAGLNQELADAEASNKARLVKLGERSSVLASQQKYVSKQISIQRERTEAASNLYVQWQGLEKTGVVSKLQVLQQHDTALQMQSIVQDLYGRLAELSQQHSSAALDLINATHEGDVEVNEIKQKITDVDRELAENEANRAIIVRGKIHLTRGAYRRSSTFWVKPLCRILAAQPRNGFNFYWESRNYALSRFSVRNIWPIYGSRG
jgi:membrane fusion protein